MLYQEIKHNLKMLITTSERKYHALPGDQVEFEMLIISSEWKYHTLPGEQTKFENVDNN